MPDTVLGREAEPDECVRVITENSTRLCGPEAQDLLSLRSSVYSRVPGTYSERCGMNYTFLWHSIGRMLSVVVREAVQNSGEEGVGSAVRLPESGSAQFNV